MMHQRDNVAATPHDAPSSPIIMLNDCNSRSTGKRSFSHHGDAVDEILGLTELVGSDMKCPSTTKHRNLSPDLSIHSSLRRLIQKLSTKISTQVLIGGQTIQVTPANMVAAVIMLANVVALFVLFTGVHSSHDYILVTTTFTPKTILPNMRGTTVRDKMGKAYSFTNIEQFYCRYVAHGQCARYPSWWH